MREMNSNYELDFLKLVFTMCVFVWYTDPFRNENTNIFSLQGGPVAVHFFYVVSGMLMANSILKRDNYFYDKKDLTLHVLAPMTAVFMLGYFCQTGSFCFSAHGIMYGHFMGRSF